MGLLAPVIGIALLTLSGSLGASEPIPCQGEGSRDIPLPRPLPPSPKKCKAQDALEAASALGCQQRVRKLLARSVRPEELTAAVSSAVGLGQVEIVEVLAAEDWPPETQRTAWTKLCRITVGYNYGVQVSRAMMEVLLAKGRPPVLPEGCAPLTAAAKFGTLEMSRILLVYGAELDARNTMERTALHVAAANSSYEIARLLIEEGADLNARDNFGFTPVHSAVDDFRMVRILIDAGADARAVSKSGFSALGLATQGNHISAAEKLIDAGADVNHRDGYGRTPLFHTAKCNNVRGVELLMRAGADPSIADHRGQTALQVGGAEALKLIRQYSNGT